MPDIGHNLPPEGVDFESLEKRTAELVENADRWQAERPTVDNADQATACKEFIDQLLAQKRAVDSHRLDQTKPLREQVESINKKHKSLADYLDASIKAMRAKLTPYLEKLQAEEDARQRQREEEAARARAAAEAAAAEAAKTGSISGKVAADELADRAKASERAAGGLARAKVSGSTGKAASLRTVYSGVIEDFDKCLAHFKDRPEIRAALQKIVDAEVRAKNHFIPGVRVDSTQTAI